MRFARTARAPCRLALATVLLGLALHAEAGVQALLIGVSDYGESKAADLAGPPNDVALMKQVLVQRFGVAADHVVLLLNPTHTAIEQAFAELAARVQPNDQVYIHYSGHGSWSVAPTNTPLDESERRGEDQTWVPHGARSERRAGKDALDVLDKELALWLDPLYRKTPDVVFVSDSCHSASMTRDVQTGVRSTDGSREPHPLRVGIRRVDAPTTGLRIGAARDFESAVELDPRVNGRCTDKDHCYGIFTWHWARALQASRPGESWGDVFERAAAAVVATPGALQRPQMEGVADRAVLGGAFAPLSALVPVQERRSDGTVVLGAGRLSGLTVGSEWAVATGPLDAAPRVRISTVAAGTAEAVAARGQVAAGDVLREVVHRSDDRPVRLYVGGPQADGVDKPLADKLRQAIDQARPLSLGAFERVAQRDTADWRLELVRPPPGTPANATALPRTVDCGTAACPAPELWVVSPLGQLMDAKMRFPMTDPGDALPRLLSNLALFAHAREVRAVGAQGNGTPLALQVAVLRPPAGNAASCLVGVKAESGWQRSAPLALSGLARGDLRLRDCLAFTIVNRDPEKTWYGYVLAVDPHLAVQSVWPPRGAMADEARIEPGKTYAIGSSLYRLSDAGRETLLFVASQVPVPLASFAQAGLRSVDARGGGSPLSRLLEASVLTRSVESEIGAWGAESVDLDMSAGPPPIQTAGTAAKP